ncbi:MAG: Gfo/Idh/MocA family oxidoreductase [Verrucomicrobia bacterium]|nr:Gfo/Idh/MocA family oxidoreductase [Verrucomicrobiota bacterium]
MSATSPRPRLAVIGISGYGKIHLQLARECRDHGEADLIAAVVINPEEEVANVAELRSKGCAIYADYAEMLRRHAGELDLCLIPTGIHWHVRMTIAALQAGANVLVEKPLAGSTDGVAAVQAAERAAGRFVAVGFQDCYDPGTQSLMAALQAGRIGAIRSVRFLGVWPRPRAYFRRNNWAGRLQVDGVAVHDSPLNNAFGHFVMLSLLLGGVAADELRLRPDEAELFRAHAIESFDTGVVTFATARGVRFWLGASHVSAKAIEPEIWVDGTAGRAGWRYEDEAWLVDGAGRREAWPVLDQHATRRLMMAAALRRLREPDAPICTTEQAGRHTALIERIHRAAPVVPFPPEQVEWVGDEERTSVPTFPGLTEAMQRAFAAQGSLRAAGFTLATGVNRA